MAKEKTQAEIRQENIEATVSKTEQFYEKYKKLIWGALIAVLVIAAAILAYGKFVYQPKCEEAQGQTYPAENAFTSGDFETALKGDGNFLGFEEIIDTYGNKAGNAVYMYAGVCALQLGDYQAALDYLKKYNGKEEILAARAKACEGDALVGLGPDNYDKAAQAYMAAAKLSDNQFAAGYYFKAGVTYEEMGDVKKALECYKTIREAYPNSVEAFDINKYISRIEIKEK